MFRHTPSHLTTLLRLVPTLAIALFTALPASLHAADFNNDSGGVSMILLILALAAAVGLGIATAMLAAGAKRRRQALAALLKDADFVGRVDNFVEIEKGIKNIIVEKNALSQEVADAAARIDELEAELNQSHGQTRTARAQGEAARCQSLKSASGTLAGAISGIHSAAGELQTATMNASGGAREQRRLSSESASAMEQMNASVAQVAESAEAAAVAADRAMEQARDGAGAVDETVSAILAVNDRTAELAEVVSGLGEQAEGIGRIMNVIADIADQTNLLALNAAIEAARAGDAGRGFAVVADEVRKLAEKTMSATQEVGDSIKAIQTGVGHTQSGMTEAAAMVEQATDLARRSGEMLSDIVNLAGENADQIRSIATAATEQSAASEQVTRAVAQVDDISSRTDEDMTASSEALENLLSGVADLDGLNGAFELMASGKVQDVLAKLSESDDIRSMEPGRIEEALRESIRKNSFIELLFLTDAKGMQPCANIPRPGQETPADAQAKGKDWSTRPWFTSAMETGTMVISEVYVSQASGDRCITVSTPFGPNEAPLGVIAADVTLD